LLYQAAYSPQLALQGFAVGGGIVTSFEFGLHRVGPVILGGMLLHPLAKTKEVLRFYRDYITKIPEELSVFLGFVTAPKAPHLPEHIQGTPVLAIIIRWKSRGGRAYNSTSQEFSDRRM